MPLLGFVFQLKIGTLPHCDWIRKCGGISYPTLEAFTTKSRTQYGEISLKRFETPKRCPGMKKKCELSKIKHSKVTYYLL